MPWGGASDGPATAAGKRRSVPAPTGVGCWRGAERATRGTRAKPADCGHALAHWQRGAGECACAPEAPRRAAVEFLNMAETNAGAVDCGGQAGSVAGRVAGGGGVCGAQLASHAGQVSSGQRRHRRAARVARRPGLQRAAASPARSSRRTPARSPAGSGVTGALLAFTLRRRARGADLANHARSRDPRYSGHSKNSSWESMSKGVVLGCLSSDSGLFHVERQPRWAARGQLDPPGGAGAGGALLRAPITARPLAACRVRALPWHGQAGGSGRGAGGAAARRGRGAAGGRWSGGTVACKWRQAKHCRNIARDGADAEPNPSSTWGVCRRGRALQKMERWHAEQSERRRASSAPLATFFAVRDHGDKRPECAHDAPPPRQRRARNRPLARATAAP